MRFYPLVGLRLEPVENFQTVSKGDSRKLSFQCIGFSETPSIKRAGALLETPAHKVLLNTASVWLDHHCSTKKGDLNCSA